MGGNKLKTGHVATDLTTAVSPIYKLLRVAHVIVQLPATKNVANQIEVRLRLVAKDSFDTRGHREHIA